MTALAKLDDDFIDGIEGFGEQTDRDLMRQFAKSHKTMTKSRVQAGNRLVASFRARMGISPSQSEDEMDSEGKKIMNSLRLSYKNITAGVADKLPSYKKFKGDGIITRYAELSLLDMYFNLENEEAKIVRNIEKSLVDYPIYTEFLKGVAGCGPVTSAWIISEIDIHKSRYASSLHKYCGYDVVVKNGEEVNGEWVEYDAPIYEGRSRKKGHLELVDYIDRNGEIKKKQSITFNPEMKTRLHLLFTSFLKCKSPYAEIYYNYKTRYQNHSLHKDKSPMHIHMMAARPAKKGFLDDLYRVWRHLEGLEVFLPYHVEKLGMVHHGDMKSYDIVRNYLASTRPEDPNVPSFLYAANNQKMDVTSIVVN